VTIRCFFYAVSIDLDREKIGARMRLIIFHCVNACVNIFNRALTRY